MAKELKKKTKTVSGADAEVAKTSKASTKAVSKSAKTSAKTVKAAKVSKAAKASVKAEAVVPKAKRGSKRSVELKQAAKGKAERVSKEVKRAEKKAKRIAEKAKQKAVKASRKAAKATEGAAKTSKVPKTSKTAKTAKVAKTKTGKGRKRWLLALAALILVIAGGITAAVCLWEHEVPEETVEIIEEEPAEPEPEPEPEGPAEGDEELVPEAEMEDWSAYTVAPNKPRFLTIAALGLYDIPIIEVGTTSGGAMGAPNSSFTVGWYYRSAYPGRVGTWATVIDGHGGSLGDGIFRTLPNIGVGAEIVIEMGDGRKFTYTVSEKVLKPKGAEADAYMKIADRPVDAETPTLTLITCTGDWIRAEQTYTHRLFVRAVMK